MRLEINCNGQELDSVPITINRLPSTYHGRPQPALEIVMQDAAYTSASKYGENYGAFIERLIEEVEATPESESAQFTFQNERITAIIIN